MAAVGHCEHLGYDHRDIVVDTIIGTDMMLDYFETSSSNSIDMLMRSAVLTEYFEKVNGVLRAK